VETILVLLVLVLIWLVARSTAEPLPSHSRESFAVSLATHSYSHKRKQLTSNQLAFSSGANSNARLWEAILTGANGALRDVERLTRLGCVLQVNNTRLRLVRRLTSAVRGSLVLVRELRRPWEGVSAHVPPHEVKRRKNVYTDVVFLLIFLYSMQFLLTQLILQSTLQNLSVLRN